VQKTKVQGHMAPKRLSACQVPYRHRTLSTFTRWRDRILLTTHLILMIHFR